MPCPHLPKTSRGILLIGLVLLTTHTGCITETGLAPPSLSAAAPPLQTAPTAHAADLYPLIEHTGTLSRTLDAKNTQTLAYRLEQVSEKQWVLRIKGVRTTHLQQADDGSILITREDEFADAVSVMYDPPLVALPAQIAMQRPIHSKSKMTVNNLKNGSPRDHGSCEYQVQLLGTRPITTESGTYDSYVVQTHRLIKLNLASASINTKTSYAPGRGWLGENIIKITQPLNLFKIKQTETLTVLNQRTPNP